MTEASRRLLELAHRNAATYASNPKVSAVLLVGSVARGIADDHSDIDATVCCTEGLTKEERMEAMARNGGADLFTLGNESGDAVGVMDQYIVDGVTCQFGIGTIGMLEDQIAAVTERFETEHDYHVIMGGLGVAVPLYGEHLVERWRTQARQYPDGLARAMVEAHLTFRPLTFLRERLAGRDDYFHFHEALTIGLRRVMGVMLGLNRLYPEHHFKRLGPLISRMEITPRDLEPRLRSVHENPPARSIEALGGLIDDTFELVARHMPDLDTAATRAKYEGR